jgi:E3 ubiquitin-protein ligase MARCH6
MVADFAWSLVMLVYPGIFAFASFVRTALVGFRMWSTWSQAIRDKEFLVEMRLRNLEPEKEEQVPDVSNVVDTETEYSSDN